MKKQIIGRHRELSNYIFRNPQYWRSWMSAMAKVPGDIEMAPPARYRSYVVYLADDKRFRLTPLTPKNMAVLVKLPEPLAVFRQAVEDNGSTYTDTFVEIPRGEGRPRKWSGVLPREWSGEERKLRPILLKYVRDVVGTPPNLGPLTNLENRGVADIVGTTHKRFVAVSRKKVNGAKKRAKV